jgi:hypothetical protein
LNFLKSSILGSEYFSGVLAKVFIRVAKLLQKGKKSLLGNKILLGPFSIFFHTRMKENAKRPQKYSVSQK